MQVLGSVAFGVMTVVNLVVLAAVLYGMFRFLVEFVREPDAQLGYLAFGWLTMGQLLSLPVLLTGLGMLAWAHARRQPSGNTA